MTSFRILTTAVLLALANTTFAQTPAPSQTILEMKDADLKNLVSSSEQVTITRSQDVAAPGIVVSIAPGEAGYPGISIKPEGAAWDLSAFGHVEARVVNTGKQAITVALRVDNAAGSGANEPWNTESVFLKPGETGTVKTIFGYAYGQKPNYKLNPATVTQMLLFTGKADTAESFRIESLVAAGPAGEAPPVDPNSIRIKPNNGDLLDGQAPVISRQTGEETWSLKPAQGRWDLRDYLEVRFKVRNAGANTITPRARVESNGGPSEWTKGAPLAAGASTEIVVPFAGSAPFNLGDKKSGTRITNDAVSAITVGAEKTAIERVLEIQSVKAALPVQQIPKWLGKRPPVDGDWIKTLDDDFKGKSLDTSIWEVYGANYWDKTTHWSKDNVLVGDGVVKLRYEKKTGFNNDDPKEKQSNYVAGYLHTFNKWAQRYGYFEARMKLPKSPGLWPAFWMMPDRGRQSNNRQDTGNGGMEFDIMEHLTRWGPNRYNIAMHYDGYGKDHKSLGSDKIYLQPDKDGFITCGLLWTPGLAVYYGNGREVLRWEDPRISNVPEMLMFTLPMGGWDNSPLDDARLPDDFVIDYVRVWQRKDLASPTDGKMTAP